MWYTLIVLFIALIVFSGFRLSLKVDRKLKREAESAVFSKDK